LTSSASRRWSTSATSAAVIDIAGESALPAGYDRRRALFLAGILSLAVASAFLGRDGPVELAPPNPILALPLGLTDVVLFTFPDRLANEAPPAYLRDVVPIRTTEGLAYVPAHGGDLAMVMWTERGTVYWLFSKQRDVIDLVRIANTLR